VNYRLIYDVATTSAAPKSTLVLGIGVLAAALLWAGWLRHRAQPLHGGLKFLGFIGALMLALSVAYRFERNWIVGQPQKIVEGAIVGHWEKRESRASDRRSYTNWEGFWVSSVSFVYARNVEQNYFHNAGPLEIRDGMPVRVHYLEERDGNSVRNQIVKFEVGAP
jgi:hypothetical protein